MQEYYIIGNKKFNSKKEIVEKIRSIDCSYEDYQPITGNDYNIIIDLLKWNSQFKTKSTGMTDIYFAPHQKYNTRCIHIAYGNTSIPIEDRPCDDISWTCCIHYIKKQKKGKESALNYKLDFGIYNGKTLKTLLTTDINYAKWILSDKFKNNKVKPKLIQAMKELLEKEKQKNMKHITQTKLFDNDIKMVDKKPVPILNNKSYKITKKDRVRMGVFYNDGTLYSVCLNSKELNDKWGKASRTLYDYMRGRVSKHGMKKGYKNLFQVRRLPIGKTFTLGEVYDLSEFQFDNITNVRKPFNRKNKTKQNIKMEIINMPDFTIPIQQYQPIVEETVITSNGEPKKGILTRIASFFRL
jgi:hypothetical protein